MKLFANILFLNALTALTWWSSPHNDLCDEVVSQSLCSYLQTGRQAGSCSGTESITDPDCDFESASLCLWLCSSWTRCVEISAGSRTRCSTLATSSPAAASPSTVWWTPTLQTATPASRRLTPPRPLWTTCPHLRPHLSSADGKPSAVSRHSRALDVNVLLRNKLTLSVRQTLCSVPMRTGPRRFSFQRTATTTPATP